MAKMNCSNEDMYPKDGTCCKRCPAGMYVHSDCDGLRPTQCEQCGRESYTATKNHLKQCQNCSVCSSENNMRKAEHCTATSNTVCECEAGFYCSNDQCEHCQPVTQCPVGEGVKFQATRTNDTVCAPCEKGSYSNVTDFLSPCKSHTRCEDIGRKIKIPGTHTADTVCDNLHHCSWMLPAGLWSGLVLTALVLLAVVVCWRAKRKWCRTARPSVPAPLVKVVPTAIVTSMELPFPSIELNNHCQESFIVKDCKLPLFHPDGDTVSCDMDINLPTTPLKLSVSFPDHNGESGGNRSSNFFRTHSEPQEDEWCGT
ncbi:tumor necrosis factor receptor superfamily member 5-like [Solea senegalensis]|uniref:Tumor necrosis factor receptor superfamily member 5-like n=1 Tax=Solea senegalensis TaxID=28829 RepID=A0AAV6PU33_SOLSE|nr:tumor necrosis factor receptor superfamily member 5 [Solea senegalensis]KAG7476257.1 tumor necrosis factor receptor superfamily member 5-like [Solea senegalensis]